MALAHSTYTTLQQERESLRQAVIHQTQAQKRPTQLRGLWRGVDFSEDDFMAARQAIFSDAICPNPLP
jgi:hypothetical protein